MAERRASPWVGQVSGTLVAMLRSPSLSPSLIMKPSRGTDHVCLIHSSSSEAQDSAWLICRCSVNIR